MTPIAKRTLHSTKSWVRYISVGLLLSGCTSINPPPTVVTPNIPTPTVSSLFRDPPTEVAGALTTLPTHVPSQPTAKITSSPTPSVLAPTRTADQVAAISLYDDALNADWSAERSSKVKFDVASTTFVHSGKNAIMVAPTADFGQFFLTVRKGAQKIYPRDRILGISFWLNGGANSIATSDLAVTVTGSNQYTYWVADDTSVKVDTPVTAETPLFSETRLYYLHINRTIPPNTWAEVILWLDDLMFDPNYSYITGMYIKNDKDILTPYYVDDVQLLVQRQP
jgi:hypothetical protein